MTKNLTSGKRFPEEAEGIFHASLTWRPRSWENNGTISLNKAKSQCQAGFRGIILSLVSYLHERLKLWNPFKLF